MISSSASSRPQRNKGIRVSLVLLQNVDVEKPKKPGAAASASVSGQLVSGAVLRITLPYLPRISPTALIRLAPTPKRLSQRPH